MGDQIDPRMTKAQFRNTIRLIKTNSLSNIMVIQTITFETLKRVGVKRDVKKAIKGIPRGSDQVNVGNIVNWLRKVPKDNAEAVAQLVTIDATCVARTKGV